MSSDKNYDTIPDEAIPTYSVSSDTEKSAFSSGSKSGSDKRRVPPFLKKESKNNSSSSSSDKKPKKVSKKAERAKKIDEALNPKRKIPDTLKPKGFESKEEFDKKYMKLIRQAEAIVKLHDNPDPRKKKDEKELLTFRNDELRSGINEIKKVYDATAEESKKESEEKKQLYEYIEEQMKVLNKCLRNLRKSEYIGVITSGFTTAQQKEIAKQRENEGKSKIDEMHDEMKKGQQEKEEQKEKEKQSQEQKSIEEKEFIKQANKYVEDLERLANDDAPDPILKDYDSEEAKKDNLTNYLNDILATLKEIYNTFLSPSNSALKIALDSDYKVLEGEERQPTWNSVVTGTGKTIKEIQEMFRKLQAKGKAVQEVIKYEPAQGDNSLGLLDITTENILPEVLSVPKGETAESKNITETEAVQQARDEVATNMLAKKRNEKIEELIRKGILRVESSSPVYLDPERTVQAKDENGEPIIVKTFSAFGYPLSDKDIDKLIQKLDFNAVMVADKEKQELEKVKIKITRDQHRKRQKDLRTRIFSGFKGTRVPFSSDNRFGVNINPLALQVKI